MKLNNCTALKIEFNFLSFAKYPGNIKYKTYGPWCAEVSSFFFDKTFSGNMVCKSFIKNELWQIDNRNKYNRRIVSKKKSSESRLNLKSILISIRGYNQKKLFQVDKDADNGKKFFVWLNQWLSSRLDFHFGSFVCLFVCVYAWAT